MSFEGRRRAPAIKLRIVDLNEGEFVTNQDGSKLLHVKTDDILRRARIMGEIKKKSIIESDETVILEVGDQTGTIKVKGGGGEFSGQIFLDMKDLKEGTVVDIVGLIRDTAEGKPYIECELCIPIKNQSLEVLRELEISKYYQRKGLNSKATEIIATAAKGQTKLNQSDEIKNHILELLKKPESLKSGLTFEEIKRALSLTTKELEPELRSLQNDGDIFEPIPGTFKFV